MVASRIADLYHRRWLVGHQLGRRPSDVGRSLKSVLVEHPNRTQKETMKGKTAIVLAMLIATPVFAQTTPAMMKAIVIHSFGGPEVLQYEDAPRPEPKEDEILIRVMAAGVNPVDAAIRAGHMSRFLGDRFPLIPGMDVAGVVEKTGAKITRFKEQGGYAEFAIAREDEMALKPKAITFDGAAAVPLAATTAWQALIDTAKIEKGQTVLIHGGSGG